MAICIVMTLVNVYTTNWKDPPCYFWKNTSLFQWPFSIAMLCITHHQRSVHNCVGSDFKNRSGIITLIYTARLLVINIWITNIGILTNIGIQSTLNGLIDAGWFQPAPSTQWSLKSQPPGTQQRPRHILISPQQPVFYVENGHYNDDMIFDWSFLSVWEGDFNLHHALSKLWSYCISSVDHELSNPANGYVWWCNVRNEQD